MQVSLNLIWIKFKGKHHAEDVFNLSKVETEDALFTEYNDFSVISLVDFHYLNSLIHVNRSQTSFWVTWKLETWVEKELARLSVVATNLPKVICMNFFNMDFLIDDLFRPI